jgi:hypothetical protein
LIISIIHGIHDPVFQRDPSIFQFKRAKKLLRFRGEKHEKDLGTHAAGNVSGWKCIGSANSAGNTP